MELEEKRAFFVKLSLAVFGLSFLSLLVIGIYYLKVPSPKTIRAADETSNLLPLDLRGEVLGVTVSVPVQVHTVNAKVSAQSFLAVDVASGTVLAQKNENERYPVASLTKMMTSLLALKYLPAGEMIDVKGGLSEVSPYLRLPAGEKVAASDLISSVMVCSANDAAAELAHAVSARMNTEFVALMNTEASHFGMNSSHFDNPNGFDSTTNYSTAQDLSILATKVFEAGIINVFGRQEFAEVPFSSGKSAKCAATNELISSDPSLLAVKTGHTEGAKEAMITLFYNKRNPVLLIVLKSDDRAKDMAELKSAVLNAWQWQ